ncbi:MAG: hypothetical protein KDA90_16955 [Planctomycetaceae bacterium]|nr:hypothetical protein [Planctomycetaceae bacterium]
MCGLMLFAACLLMQAGCVNVLAIASKVILGDPMQPSAFELATGEKLAKSGKTVLLYCSAPPLLVDEFGSISSDVQEELIQRMKRHKINVLPPDAGTDVIDRIGRFDAHALGREMKGVDYIMHVQLEDFTIYEQGSTDFYRCRSKGKITGYEVRSEGDGARMVVEVFEHNFNTQYPSAHPVPVDQTPKTVFMRRGVDFVADSLGTSFYEVFMADLYAR